MATEAATTKRTKDQLLRSISGLVIDPYDSLELTYVAAGNGAGKVETAKFYQGGTVGTLIATITITYDGDNKVSSVVRT